MSPDYILIFENEYVRSLYPFSILHMQWEVRCGAFRIFEKIQRRFPSAKILFHSHRKNTLELFLKKFNIDTDNVVFGNVLIINAGILPTEKFWQSLFEAYEKFLATQQLTKSVVFATNGIPLALYLARNDIVNPTDFDLEFFPLILEKYSNKLPKTSIEPPRIINFLWDAIEYNSDCIAEDFKFFDNFADFEQLKRNSISLINEDLITIGKDSYISTNVVLDASKGPIILGEGVQIQPFTFIEGPVFIGNRTNIKSGSTIFQGTSIGEVCKVGGEIENSILQAYSNKQHYGFLGHSYIGEWVNIGAGTTTSDLKNTYESISVRIETESFDTGRTFLGLICGDHTKTAINTSFNSGTIAGICCNIYHSGLLPKYIPSFTWGGDRSNSTLGSFERSIETAKIVMARRDQKLLDQEIRILQLEYESSKSKRLHSK